MSIFRNQKLERTIGVVLDVLFALVLFFALSMAVSSLAMRGNGFFGLRLGVIRSDSMEASNYQIGDVVSVHREKEYGVGDVIVFYRATSQYGVPFEEADLRATAIWVHEVVAVREGARGQEYLTKGSSNPTDDGYYVPHDFVAGRAALLPAALNAVVRFVASPTGILSFVILPCAAMAIYLIWELIMLLTWQEEESAYALAPEEETYYRGSFMSRLVLADEEVKRRYSALKNALLGYRAVTPRVSRACESYRVHGKLIAKLNVRGKKLLLALALSPADVAEKYCAADRSRSGRRYAGVPCEVRVQSERGVKFARELVAQLAAAHGLEAVEREEQDYAPPAMAREEMVAAGYLRRGEKFDPSLFGRKFPAGEEEAEDATTE